jgi:hypothetical protein
MARNVKQLADLGQAESAPSALLARAPAPDRVVAISTRCAALARSGTNRERT